ncbi:MAG: hypothetical protein M1827_001024 [Pycnora praestabilis]|nr:MAG: hypothetical protein M1827_001024 [Pycnora praestabilis]
MDGLSGAASIIAVVEIALQVTSACQEYYNSARDSRKSIRALSDGVTSLSDVLLNLEAIIESPGGEKLAMTGTLTKPNGPLQACYQDLEAILKKLDIKPGKLYAVRKKLTWPFEEKDVSKLVANVERHKSTIGLGLSVDNTALAIASSDGILQIRKTIAATQDDDHRNLMLRWLSTVDPSTNHNIAREKHEATTGTWLIEGDAFKTWRCSPNSLLWLHGKGALDDTTTSTVIDHLQRFCGQNRSYAIAYFYFDFNDAKKQSMREMTKSLVVQLCRQTFETSDSLKDAYQKCQNGHQDPTTDQLKTILAECLDMFSQAFLIVDALDECPKAHNEREKLLCLVDEINSWSHDRLHLLVTSRRERDIENLLASSTTSSLATPICLEAAPVHKDIESYIESQLKSPKFEKWPNKIRDDVKATLTSKADGMFRWVALQLETLQKHHQSSKITKALATLPKDLDKTYDRILQNIDDDLQDQAFTALQWLCFSARPLRLGELAEAVVIKSSNDPPFDPEDRLFNPSDVLDLLPGLVNISMEKQSDRFTDPFFDNALDYNPDEEDDQDREGKNNLNILNDLREITLAHFSVKEYLVSSLICTGAASNFKICPDEANLSIAKICLSYFSEVANVPCTMLKDVIKRQPLLPYAARYWPEHTRSLPQGSWDSFLNPMCDDNFDQPGSLLPNWIRMSDPDNSMRSSPSKTDEMIATWLYYAVSHNLVQIVDRLLAPGKGSIEYANKEGGFYGNALQAASQLGHESIVQLLLTAGADVNKEGGYYGNALQAASSCGHESIVQLLLTAGADVNKEGGYYGTALQAASRFNKKSTVQLLLAAGINVNKEGGQFNNALQAASSCGHESIVQLLLTAGVNVNKEGGHLGNALQTASFCGHESIVQLLLTAGANVNKEGGYYGNALQAASYRGHESTVQLLLTAGANINKKGGCYGTALQAASYLGHESIVQLLLTAGADVNKEGGANGSELQAASYFGYESIVQLLLTAGADVNAKEGLRSTALQIASGKGCVEILKLLIAAGADIKSQGGKALRLAKENNHEDTLQVLLEAGAEYEGS